MTIGNVENVVLYVADSLRWDAQPPAITKRGVTCKTVAQSLHSPSSFATLLTGRYVGEHGVYSWNHRLSDELTTLCDIPGHNTSFYQADTPTQNATEDPIFSVLRQDLGHTITEIDPPFIYIERDLAPHIPYGNEVGQYDTADEYLRTFANNFDALAESYADGVNQTVNHFEGLLEKLERLGLREETLVIFTSDHGELLGEHHNVGHNSPMCPELVYVPTTFIHPSLSGDSFSIDITSDVIEHVDIVATILGLLNNSGIFDHSGVNLFNSERSKDVGFSTIKHTKFGRTLYGAQGVFDHAGGYVRATNNSLARLIFIIALAVRSTKRHTIRSAPIQAARPYLPEMQRFGYPEIKRRDAIELLENFEGQWATGDSERHELDQEAEDHLRKLGYLN